VRKMLFEGLRTIRGPGKLHSENVVFLMLRPGSIFQALRWAWVPCPAHEEDTTGSKNKFAAIGLRVAGAGPRNMRGMTEVIIISQSSWRMSGHLA
jgi:hypothetical protein